MSSNLELVGIDIQLLLKSIMRKPNKSSHSCYNFIHLLNSCRGKTNKYYSMLHCMLRTKTGLYFTAYSITKTNHFRILGKEKDQKTGIWCKRRVELDITYVLNFVTWNYTSSISPVAAGWKSRRFHVRKERRLMFLIQNNEK